jgi:hypothetical protein
MDASGGRRRGPVPLVMTGPLAPVMTCTLPTTTSGADRVRQTSSYRARRSQSA